MLKIESLPVGGTPNLEKKVIRIVGRSFCSGTLAVLLRCVTAYDRIPLRLIIANHTGLYLAREAEV